MSTLVLDENQSHYQIRAFKPGMIQINDVIFTHSLIISPNQLINDWPPQLITELSSKNLNIIQSLKPDILLIGTGQKLEFIPIEIYGDLINHGIGIEIMNTSAACRTYNALAAEERNVVAALIIQ